MLFDHPRPVEVRLGDLLEGGLAPAILAVVERGAIRRPDLAISLRAEVELAPVDGFPPVRILLTGAEILVEDGPAARPDVRIRGSLADLISLMVAPLARGVPNPVRPRGRAALGLLAQRRVRFEGRLAPTRQFLMLIRV